MLKAREMLNMLKYEGHTQKRKGGPKTCLKVIQLDELHLFHSDRAAAFASSIPITVAASSSLRQPMDQHPFLVEMEHSAVQTPFTYSLASGLA